MKRIASLAILATGLILAALSIAAPAPVVAQDPTLDAAIGVVLAATRAEQDRRNAVAATRAAVEAEAIRQQSAARATAAALSAEQTRTAIEATRSHLATRAAVETTVTRQALDAQATARSIEITRQAISLDETRQAAAATAIMAAIQSGATRQAIQRQAESERARESLYNVGLVILFVIGIILSTLTGRGLYRITHPIVVIDDDGRGAALPRPDSSESSSRMPDTVQIVDDPRMVEALDHWAEKYDATREVTHGD